MTRLPYGNDPFRPSYSERLIIMSLPTLKDRRIRGDVIFTFKSLRLEDPLMQDLFTLSPYSRTRGHCFKLKKENFRTTVRQHFITNRVFDTWNKLPEEVVQSPNVNVFKSRFDSL
ncbi:hypothetical protein Zmor_024604 [Zophobas morio]|uniref:Uncharacterized protein n=1 Tax=Zophobas morio TaxID=2755281 RepID=A0AA38I0L6_9CUCU|nr:hypothetical protein Zmor_024604 [Zophobas morio]